MPGRLRLSESSSLGEAAGLGSCCSFYSGVEAGAARLANSCWSGWRSAQRCSVHIVNGPRSPRASYYPVLSTKDKGVYEGDSQARDRQQGALAVAADQAAARSRPIPADAVLPPLGRGSADGGSKQSSVVARLEMPGECDRVQVGWTCHWWRPFGTRDDALGVVCTPDKKVRVSRRWVYNA